MRFCFFSWFLQNCELIKDSSLWCSNFIPSVRDSVIIIELEFVTYTFALYFNYKYWIWVSIKIWILAFLGKYFNIICWVSKRVNWVSHYFLNFFAFFGECFSPSWVETIPETKIFSSFLACLGPVWLEMTPKWCFLIFRIILLFSFKFFWECSSQRVAKGQVGL